MFDHSVNAVKVLVDVVKKLESDKAAG
jgi:hypothetical protein